MDKTYDIIIRAQEVNMGLFGNKKTEEELMEEALAENNIFEGFKCNVVFPDTQLKVATHGDVTKDSCNINILRYR